MTTKIISNNYYGGSQSVGSSAVVAEAAASLYATYAARVAADGGTVNDPAGCQASIAAAISGDYYWRTAAAVSPDWGYKLTGGFLTKLYSIVGTIDAVSTGVSAISLDTTTYTKPLAILGGGKVMTFSSVPLLGTNSDGLAALSVLTVASGNGIDTFTFTSGGIEWDLHNACGGAFPSVATAGVVRFISNPEYDNPSLVAHALMIEMGTQLITGIQNGSQMKSITGSNNGFTPLAPGASADIVYTGGAVLAGERWFFNNVSDLPGLAAMQTATVDATARY